MQPSTLPNAALPAMPPEEPSGGQAVDHLSLISLPTAASSAGVLLLIAAWLAALVAFGMWQVQAPASEIGLDPAGSFAISRLLWALALSASLALLSVVIAMLITWVRPLRSLVRATTSLIQGQWHRPIPQSIAAIAPVQQLAVIYEDLRGSLVDRLRSSTELNLQLESEVARRTAELERRNTELAALLARLEATRAELLRNQKLATVGRIASDAASAIAEPMQRLTQLALGIGQGFTALRDAGALPDGERPPPLAARLALLGDQLGLLIASAAQASEVVRALRVYARPDPGPYAPPLVPESSAPKPAEKPDPTAPNQAADPP